MPKHPFFWSCFIVFFFFFFLYILDANLREFDKMVKWVLLLFWTFQIYLSPFFFLLDSIYYLLRLSGFRFHLPNPLVIIVVVVVDIAFNGPQKRNTGKYRGKWRADPKFCVWMRGIIPIPLQFSLKSVGERTSTFAFSFGQFAILLVWNHCFGVWLIIALLYDHYSAWRFLVWL